uniref:F-box domain-containing protein n=1 Tax=Meloidogyne incognita TaxID=6306 RepID=A0A914KQH7_MELIC
MSEDRKIIEHEGLKYYKAKGQWYQISPIEDDKVPVDIKTKKLMKLDLLPEIQLDIFKCLSFTQLLTVQQTNVYFKNFIYEHGKVLAMKKFNKLEFHLVNNETINRYKEHVPQPKLYDFELDEHRFCDFGMCEQKYKFFKPEPRLYEFELGEELEEKWNDGIKNSVPMFLTSGNAHINTVVCEFEQNYKTEKDLYYFQLSKFAKNIKEMKIARYFFNLLFNCAFDFFEVYLVIINPQMVELLFDNEITTNKHLQIHSKETQLYLYEDHYLTFALNHLVTNRLHVEIYETFDVEKNLDILFQILANGGNKFSNITYEYSNSKLYNLIIEYIETSQNICKMVKKIKFDTMHGSLISSKRAKNIQIKNKKKGKDTNFHLSNKHNPNIVFSVLIKEGGLVNLTTFKDFDTFVPAVDAVIRRIN